MNPGKKICFLTHNLKQDNGAGVFSSRLIQGLSGFESVTFTHWELFPLWRFFRKLAVIKSCDLIHALDAFPYGILAVFAGVLFNKKVIITAVGTGAVNRLYHPFYSLFLKWAYRRADRVVAISNFTKREILKKIPDLKIEVINHGVDAERFQVSGSKFQDLKPYILSVGTLRWRKGYHRSIAAFAEVSKVFPNLKYVIVGKRYQNDYYNRLRLEIRDLKLEGKIIILDNIDKEGVLIQLYKNAELFCLMSQTANHDMEGFGLVFLEAAAAGLPVVGTQGSGVDDAVSEGKNAFLVEPRDEKACAEAIKSILEKPDLRINMSKESLKLAASFSWEKKIGEYSELYKNLTSYIGGV